MQYKYKVGDRVIAGENLIHAPEYVGKEGYIVSVLKSCAYPYLVRFDKFLELRCKVERKVDDRLFVSIEYGEDKPTVARMFKNGKVVKTVEAEAQYNPKDEYDAQKGIALAVEQLFAKPKKVFSIKAWMKDMIDYPDNIELAIKNGWIRECDGKTVEECEALGYGVWDSWLVDKE